jgi:hypothetical protein
LYAHLFLWDDVLRADPEIIVIMPCALLYDLKRNTKELSSFGFPAGWNDLRAVHSGVFAVN